MGRTDLLRRLPKIDVLLAQKPLVELGDTIPYEQIRSFTRNWIEQLRRDVLTGKRSEVPDIPDIAQEVCKALVKRGRFHLKPVVNATGIVLHTNLGRAPLGKAVVEHIGEVACGYSNLEYSLSAGKRGSRYRHVESLICEVTGAEAACVVNNNAGAVFLILDTLCKNAGVAISRGELVEIGGSFRVPEIMDRSGAKLIEVGTTNKTHVSDYETALVRDGATALLKVHTSNFVMEGFTESVSIQELADLAAKSNPRPLVIYDVGAALIVPPETIGIQKADNVKELVRAGADIVSFSGDKLLGSAQAGIIVGRKDLIDQIKRNQLCRMLRIDKLSLAALEITLQSCTNAERAQKEVPILSMLSQTPEECRQKAEALKRELTKEFPASWFDIVDTQDEAGGGSLPGVMLPGAALAVSIPGLTAEELEQALRDQTKPIIVRVQNEVVLMSVRTIFSEDYGAIVAALADVLGKSDKVRAQ